uniref:Uncharacterized protein n=1 Tax=Rhodnius prolixus TaxID=13249 RepID=T1HP50_RHOPR
MDSDQLWSLELSEPVVNLISYLTQFGYLPESDRETGYLRTDVQLRQAVKQLQKEK